MTCRSRRICAAIPDYPANRRSHKGYARLFRLSEKPHDLLVLTVDVRHPKRCPSQDKEGLIMAAREHRKLQGMELEFV